MRSKMILALVLLNVMLLASLCFNHGFTRSADAQVAAAARPSEYLMISGEVQGGVSGVVFIIDTRNNFLSARTFENKAIEDMPPLDLNRVFK